MSQSHLKSVKESRDPLEKWHVTPSTNRNYHFLDGLRGIAILMVIGSHFIYVNPHAGPATAVAGTFVSVWGQGVRLFFVLSGFLISWPFWNNKLRTDRKTVPKGYGWRRFYKIYPPIVFSFLFLVPLYIWQTGDYSYIPLAFKWLVGAPLVMPISGKLNPVMWSLVVETQFYLTLPVVMLACRRLSMRVCVWLVPALFFAFGIGQQLLLVFGWLPHFPFPQILDEIFPSNTDFFAFGMLVSGLHAQGRIAGRHARWAWLGAVIFFLAVVHSAWLHYWGNQSALQFEIVALGMQVGCGMMLLCIGNPQGLLPRLLSNVVLRWCGIVSYEWYLWHQPLANLSRNYFGSAGGGLIRYASIIGFPLILSVLIAAAAYRFVSLPILRWGRLRHSE